MLKIIDAATLPAEVKRRAGAVFTRLAEAEAHIHGTTTDAVHFHEVGALAAGSFRYQTAGTVNAGRMELNELHVL